MLGQPVEIIVAHNTPRISPCSSRQTIEAGNIFFPVNTTDFVGADGKLLMGIDWNINRAFAIGSIWQRRYDRAQHMSIEIG